MHFQNSLPIRLIEEKLGCGFWRRDVGADEMQWSKGLFRLYDRDPEKDKASYSLMREGQHPEDRLTFATIDGNVRAGTLFDREYRVVLRDGSIRRLAHHGEVIFDRRARPSFDVAVVWDIGDRKPLLDEVLQDNGRVKAVLDALDYFIGMLQADGFDANFTRAIDKDTRRYL